MTQDINCGFVQIPRSIRTTFVFHNPTFLQWWLDLTMMASYRTQHRFIGQREVRLLRGQLIASVSYLCQRWQRSRNTVKAFLRRLVHAGLISKMCRHNVNVITLNSYDPAANADFAGVVDLPSDPPFDLPLQEELTHLCPTSTEANNGCISSDYVGSEETVAEELTHLDPQQLTHLLTHLLTPSKINKKNIYINNLALIDKKVKTVKGDFCFFDLDQDRALAEEFFRFHRAYQGTKRSKEIELASFIAQEPLSWRDITPTLLASWEKLKENRGARRTARQFVEPLPYLKTWLAQQRWTMEYGEVEQPQTVDTQSKRPAKKQHEPCRAADLREQAQWCEQLCQTYQLEPQQLDESIDDFGQHLTELHKQHTSLYAMRHHFRNWLEKNVLRRLVRRKAPDSQPPTVAVEYADTIRPELHEHDIDTDREPTDGERHTAQVLTQQIKADVERANPSARFDSATAQHIDKTARWLCQMVQGFPRLQPRGLILSGGCGSGKTTIANAVDRLFCRAWQGQRNEYGYPLSVRRISSQHITDTFCNAEKGVALCRELSQVSLLIVDDIGKEPPTVMNYGTRFVPLATLLRNRYAAGLPTILTTNLHAEEFALRYGTDVYDRLAERYDMIAFNNQSFRRK